MPPGSWDWVEQVRLVVYHPDSHAFSATLTDMDRIEFATLYTLQHGLAGYAEQPGGLLHNDITIGNVIDRLAAKVIVSPTM